MCEIVHVRVKRLWKLLCARDVCERGACENQEESACDQERFHDMSREPVILKVSLKMRKRDFIFMRKRNFRAHGGKVFSHKQSHQDVKNHWFLNTLENQKILEDLKVRLLVAACLTPRVLGAYTSALSTSSSLTAFVVSSCDGLRP